MRDGTLVRVTKIDESLQKVQELRLLSKFFSDFTDFVETIKEFCNDNGMLYEAEPCRIQDTSRIVFYTNEEIPQEFGSMEVQVCVENYVACKEFNNRR